MDWKTLLNPDRRRKSTITGDHRDEFERDFDRAVFSTPVKRLQDKAQVFPLEPHDAVRTRLTHSLEVSSVARGLGRKAAGWLLEQHVIEPGMDRSIEAIAATCGECTGRAIDGTPQRLLIRFDLRGEQDGRLQRIDGLVDR